MPEKPGPPADKFVTRRFPLIYEFTFFLCAIAAVGGWMLWASLTEGENKRVSLRQEFIKINNCVMTAKRIRRTEYLCTPQAPGTPFTYETAP